MPPAVAGHDEDGALAENVRGEEAHHGEESLVVGAHERVVEEERHAPTRPCRGSAAPRGAP